jgi:hypothetical protein
MVMASMIMVGSQSTTPRIEKSDFLLEIFFEIGNRYGSGTLSIATFKKKSDGKSDFAICSVVD